MYRSIVIRDGEAREVEGRSRGLTSTQWQSEEQASGGGKRSIDFRGLRRPLGGVDTHDNDNHQRRLNTTRRHSYCSSHELPAGPRRPTITKAIRNCDEWKDFDFMYPAGPNAEDFHCDHVLELTNARLLLDFGKSHHAVISTRAVHYEQRKCRNEAFLFIDNQDTARPNLRNKAKRLRIDLIATAHRAQFQERTSLRRVRGWYCRTRRRPAGFFVCGSLITVLVPDTIIGKCADLAAIALQRIEV